MELVNGRTSPIRPSGVCKTAPSVRSMAKALFWYMFLLGSLYFLCFHRLMTMIILKRDMAVLEKARQQQLVSLLPVRPLHPRAQRQATLYRQGHGLILNVHMIHHGGSTVCDAVGHALNVAKGGTTPSLDCWIARRNPDGVRLDYPHHNPWRSDETAANAETVRQYFHMITWQFDAPPRTPLTETQWEDAHLFSIMVMRDPMERMLAGGEYMTRYFPNVLHGNASVEELTQFSHSDRTENNVLRILANEHCCPVQEDAVDSHNTNPFISPILTTPPTPIDRTHLEAAKALLRRFSVIIDMECLSETLQLLAQNEWNITLGPMTMPATSEPPPSSLSTKTTTTTAATPREIIGNDAIYEYLLQKNELDVELYQWSKSVSYLDCSQLQSSLVANIK